ncbi:MAG TPA: SDR family NAD(P)-dependent oxidoreductase [Pseudolabrys sp.]|nr:SDR family NAD(P)-dependent oxidoreductase [Xanthobacteraceae bacterium]HMF24770.1 SDR family NAD(P)-dependent oxidoreductase [Pseudolabrys sp.]
MHPKGHAALVTGGGSGLGRTTAERLAALGAKVAILDVNGEAARAAAAKIGGIGIACDVTSADGMVAAVAEARSRHGAARILVACAGIGPARRIVGRDGPQPLEDFGKVINVNLIGTYNAIRLAAADMQPLTPLEDGERGVIVSTASVAAYDGQIGQAAYAASKGGVVSLTLPAAREFAQFGIRVMTIAPGIFTTPMLAGLPEQVQESLAAAIPFPKRLGQPDQYADLVQHIIENRYLNGEVIRLDGAIRMAPR